MKIVQHGRKRKAISPVLATVILIAITLIAAIAVAGFVFGLFGTFTSSATVTAQVTSCTSGAATDVCIVNLSNTGSGNTAVSACSINIAGIAVTGAATPVNQKLTAGAGFVPVTCTVTTGAAVQTSGSMVTGTFSTTNGASVPFSSTWQ